MPKAIIFEDDTMADATLRGISNADFDCHYCKHIHKDGVTCDAFRKMIPAEILVGAVIHNKKYAGDNGIQFEAKI